MCLIIQPSNVLIKNVHLIPIWIFDHESIIEVRSCRSTAGNGRVFKIQSISKRTFIVLVNEGEVFIVKCAWTIGIQWSTLFPAQLCFIHSQNVSSVVLVKGSDSIVEKHRIWKVFFESEGENTVVERVYGTLIIISHFKLGHLLRCEVNNYPDY